MKNNQEEKSYEEMIAELEVLVAKQTKMLKLNKAFGFVLLITMPIMFLLLVLSFFYSQVTPYLDFVLALFNVIVITYMLYSNYNFGKHFWKTATTEMKMLRVASFICLIIIACNVANYIVKVFNIQINF